MIVFCIMWLNLNERKITKLQTYKLTSKMNILYVMLFNLELFLDVVINQNMLYEN